MEQFSVLKEVYTINDDSNQTDTKMSVSIDDFDPMCSNLPPWTMTPQVNIICCFIFIDYY
jgi:hypothetical protein